MFRLIRIYCIAIAIFFLSANAFAAGRNSNYLKMVPKTSFEKMRCRVVGSIDLPKWYHEGLFLDGKSIWVANGKAGPIWVVDTETGSITSEIKPVAEFTESVTRIEGDQYFVTDWATRKLYKARLKGGEFVAESETSLFPGHPAGAVWTGEKLFLITWTRGVGTKFDLLEMDRDANIIRRTRITAIQEPAHMAWDGKNLWITSWYSRRIYKVDVDRSEILGAFKSPVPLATGIAWDGEALWITGTYSGLYKLKIE